MAKKPSPAPANPFRLGAVVIQTGRPALAAKVRTLGIVVGGPDCFGRMSTLPVLWAGMSMPTMVNSKFLAVVSPDHVTKFLSTLPVWRHAPRRARAPQGPTLAERRRVLGLDGPADEPLNGGPADTSPSPGTEWRVGRSLVRMPHPGTVVMHEVFGRGRVVEPGASAARRPAAPTLYIEFDKFGVKGLVWALARGRVRSMREVPLVRPEPEGGTREPGRHDNSHGQALP